MSKKCFKYKYVSDELFIRYYDYIKNVDDE